VRRFTAWIALKCSVAAKGLFDPANSDLDFIVQMTGQRNRHARRSVPLPIEFEASSAVR